MTAPTSANSATWMPPLPEPDPDMQGRERAPGVYQSGYTADQMRARDAVVARAALEQAAKVCQNERFVYSDEEWRIRCELADAIRVMAKDIE